MPPPVSQVNCPILYPLVPQFKVPAELNWYPVAILVFPDVSKVTLGVPLVSSIKLWTSLVPNTAVAPNEFPPWINALDPVTLIKDAVSEKEALWAQLAVPNREPVRLLIVARPVTFNEPVILTEPVNWWVLVSKVPNLVEPVTKSVEEVIVWATIVCTVNVLEIKALLAVILFLTIKLSADDAVNACDAVAVKTLVVALNVRVLLSTLKGLFPEVPSTKVT